MPRVSWNIRKCHEVMGRNGIPPGSSRVLPEYYHGRSTTSRRCRVASLALEYLEYAERYPPPSYRYVQKHMRWIFRDVLQPNNDPSFDRSDYEDYRVKLWPLLVRSFVREIDQFRMFVALDVRLSGGYDNDDRVRASSSSLGSIRHYLIEDATFGSVKKAGRMMTTHR